MSRLKYANIPLEVLLLPNIDVSQKIILGLACSMPKGLLLGNKCLSMITGKSESRVNQLISDLRQKGYVNIENRQSRHRKIKPNTENIYSAISCQVEGDLLDNFEGLLDNPQLSTWQPTVNINKGNKKNKSFSPLPAYELPSGVNLSPEEKQQFDRFGTLPATDADIEAMEMKGVF